MLWWCMSLVHARFFLSKQDYWIWKRRETRTLTKQSNQPTEFESQTKCLSNSKPNFKENGFISSPKWLSIPINWLRTEQRRMRLPIFQTSLGKKNRNRHWSTQVLSSLATKRLVTLFILNYIKLLHCLRLLCLSSVMFCFHKRAHTHKGSQWDPFSFSGLIYEPELGSCFLKLSCPFQAFTSAPHNY